MAGQTHGKHAMPTPVVTDGAGDRSVSVQWARRVVWVALAIGAGAMVLSLSTHVLPSSDDPSPASGISDVPSTGSSDTSPSIDATTPTPTSPTTTQSPRAETDRTGTATQPTTAPTKSSPTATADEPDEPEKSPTHRPGPPTEPPGKPK